MAGNLEKSLTSLYGRNGGSVAMDLGWVTKVIFFFFLNRKKRNGQHCQTNRVPDDEN
jgi:hypothetical protein